MRPHTRQAEYHNVREKTRSSAHDRRWCIDVSTTLLLFAVWACLLAIGIILLAFTRYATSLSSDAGIFVSAEEVADTIALTALPVFVAAVLNEILVDRAWRRIVYYAMGRKQVAFNYAELADNLRAANLSLWTFIKRFFQSKVSTRELRSALSYALIRWGSTTAIASAQLAVTWKKVSHNYMADKRHLMLIVPILIHAISILGAVAIWRWPWMFFSDRSNDFGLFRKYRPYLDTVEGSLATFDDVAKRLEQAAVDEAAYCLPPGTMLQNFGPRQKLVVKTTIKSGRQMWPKIKDLSWGLGMMFVPPAAAWGFVHTKYTLTTAEYRFALVFIFLSQNIFYNQALDYAIWNISLDGFCKTPKANPNTSMRHLGFAAGTMVLLKAARQRRPLRAAFFLWTFWLQACGMRLLSVVYSLCGKVLSYYELKDLSDMLNPDFWLAWMILTSVFTLPLFAIWIFKKVDAPVCAVDGWRWAQIARDALQRPGYYGMKDGRAVWAMDVELFGKHIGEPVS